MPRIDAKLDRRKAKRMVPWVRYGASGEWIAFGMARAFDTDEKWLEVFLLGPGNKCLVLDHKIHTARIYVDYDIRDRRTKKLLYSVRQ